MLFYEKVKPNRVDDNKTENDKNMDTDNKQVAMSSGYDVFQPDVQRSNKAHSWHTFLFDTEFQHFLKRVVELCPISNDIPQNPIDSMGMSSPSSSSSLSIVDDAQVTWPSAILQISLTYFFEVLLHSVDNRVLGDWVKKLSAALENDPSGARWFVHKLARKTTCISANWLRIYVADCPEESSRNAAVKTIGAAIASCISFSNEQSALKLWIDAWKQQVESLQSGVLPTNLIGKSHQYEVVDGLEVGSSSSIGILISYITLLLEHAPRTWRYNSELCLLIRDISSIDPDCGGMLVRRALIEAQVPARLICLALREKSPVMLKNAFQGASISYVVAEAVVRNETPPSSHLLNLDAGAVGMGASMGNSNNTATAPCPSDHMNLIECIGCLIGVPGGKRAILVEETDEFLKGRPSVILSKDIREAFAVIFSESKTSDAGMGHRDIENYMQRCGVDSATVHPHKIASILNKYPTIAVGAKRVLSLDGFLAYYRDTAQTNEAQVRSDLHTFGFRPDLSRRRSNLYATSIENVAQDTSLALKGKDIMKIGSLAENGLQSFYLHALAYSACEPLAECILATCAYGQDTNKLLTDALKALSRAPTGWAGAETFNACLMIFKVLVAIPDERQQERIKILMQSREKCSPHAELGVGLLIAAKECSTSRSNQHYPVDFHYSVAVERYINVVKELMKIHKVNEWMGNNREMWAWMEHWFRPEGSGSQQVRGDLSGGRDGAGSAPLNHHHHTTSEMNPVMGNDDESDDYGFDSIVVEGAGEPAVNGTYLPSGNCDNVGKCVKEGRWQDRDCNFSLFRCKLSDGTRRWYISIVPPNHVPGTNKDTDFYSAQATGIEHERPPERNWTTAKGHGFDPAPSCTCTLDVSVEEDDDVDDNGRVWNGQSGNGNEDSRNRELGFL